LEAVLEVDLREAAATGFDADAARADLTGAFVAAGRLAASADDVGDWARRAAELADLPAALAVFVAFAALAD